MDGQLKNDREIYLNKKAVLTNGNISVKEPWNAGKPLEPIYQNGQMKYTETEMVWKVIGLGNQQRSLE